LAPPRTRSRRLLLVLGAALLALAATAAPAGANLISPESPHSPNASDINTLYWIVLVVAVIVIVGVNAALLGAVMRFRERRGVQPRLARSLGGLQAIVFAGLAAFAIALFTVSVVFTEKARKVGETGPNGLQKSAAITEGSGASPIGTATPPASKNANPLQITATGQEWLWRYTYPNGAFSYYRLVVPVDTAVQLNLVSTDVIHGWYVPQLGGKLDAVPGKTNRAWFKADETGTYLGRSSTFSGPAFAADRIEVEVVSPAEYQSFVDQQLKEIQDAQDIVVQQIQSGETP
jgi:cytochrome c oxidase subunit 2